MPDNTLISHIIKLDSLAGDGLPCGTGDGYVICGQPARIAMLDPDPDRPGRWILTPICRICVAALAVMYDTVPESPESVDFLARAKADLASGNLTDCGVKDLRKRA